VSGTRGRLRRMGRLEEARGRPATAEGEGRGEGENQGGQSVRVSTGVRGGRWGARGGAGKGVRREVEGQGKGRAPEEWVRKGAGGGVWCSAFARVVRNRSTLRLRINFLGA